MRYLATCVLVLTGCGAGSGDGVAIDPLAGTTWSTTVAGSSCESGFGFTTTHNYIHFTVCTQNDGSQAIEQDVGIYAVSGHQLNLTMQEASCPPSIYLTFHLLFDFAVSGNILTLSFPNGVLMLDRAPSIPIGGGDGGAAPYGCFDANRVFTPRPLAPLY